MVTLANARQAVACRCHWTAGAPQANPYPLVFQESSNAPSVSPPQRLQNIVRKVAAAVADEYSKTQISVQIRSSRFSQLLRSTLDVGAQRLQHVVRK